ncbi:hypothetical protein [Tumebacillus lipolyticus]|uniref:Uncharacterized protein n=1 Tax=Tumebacillus lipolyticus TaxID=1280370 RepID=A0ABW5A0F7_9BACL
MKMFQPPVQTPSGQSATNAPIQGQSERSSQGMRERRAPSGGTAPLSAAHILQLQKTVGNRAVVQMLRKQEAMRQQQAQAAEQQAQTNAPAQMVVQREEEEEDNSLLALGSGIFQDLKSKYIVPELIKYGKSLGVDAFFKVVEIFITAMLESVPQCVKLMAQVLMSFRQLLDKWEQMNPNLKAGIKFMVGLAINKFDQFMASYWSTSVLSNYESYAADDGEFPKTVEKCLELFQYVPFVSYSDLLTSAKDYLKRAIGLETSSTPSSSDQQGQSNPKAQERVNGISVDLKLIKVDMQNLAISKSKPGDPDRRGGLDLKSQVTFRFFGSEFKVDELHAHLDWDLKWSIDAAIEGLEIIDRYDFLFFEIEKLYLMHLNVGNKGLNALEVALGKFKAGDLLEVNEVFGSYHKGKGFLFEAGMIDLRLPSPFDSKIQSSASLMLDEDGAFKQVKLENFQVGKKVKMKEGTLTPDYLHIQELEYNFGSGSKQLTPKLYDLLITKDKEIQSVRGGVEIKDWEVFDGLVVDGAAYVGYEKQFYLGVQGAKVRLDKGLVHGYGAIKRLQYNEDRTFEGEIDRLAFSLGVFALDAEGVKIEKDGSLWIDEAEVVLGKQDEVSSKDMEAMSQGGGKDSLMSSLGVPKKSGGFSSLASVHLKAHGVRIKDGKYEVTKYEKWIGPSKVYKVSLFGGAVQGMIDQEKKKANLSGQVELPKSSAFWPLKFGASLPVPPTPLSLFVEVGIGGGIKAMIAGEIAQDQEHPDESLYNVAGLAYLEGNLKFSVGAGVKIGTEFLLALRAYLEASATLRAAARAELKGQVRLNPDKDRIEQDERKKLSFTYDLEGELTAKIEALVDFVAFLVYQKKLYSKTLGSWTLGHYRMSGEVGEEGGRLKDEIKTPQAGSGVGDTLGGALSSPIKLPEDQAMEQLMHWNDPINSLQGKEKLPNDPHLLYRTAHGLLSKETDLDQRKIEQVKEQLKQVAAQPRTVDAIVREAADSILDRRGRKLTSHLMTKEEWIRYSTVDALIGVKDRVSIKEVDKLLDSYHSKSDALQKKEVLLDLRDELNKYLLMKGKSRKQMALKLLMEIDKEAKLLGEPEEVIAE